MKINMKGYEELKKAHKEKAKISKTDLIKVCCRIATLLRSRKTRPQEYLMCQWRC